MFGYVRLCLLVWLASYERDISNMENTSLFVPHSSAFHSALPNAGRSAIALRATWASLPTCAQCDMCVAMTWQWILCSFLFLLRKPQISQHICAVISLHYYNAYGLHTYVCMFTKTVTHAHWRKQSKMLCHVDVIFVVVVVSLSVLVCARSILHVPVGFTCVRSCRELFKDRCAVVSVCRCALWH